ncbi:MAG: hypothetical protein KDA91_12870, partial [Planctomycetaceae bacterium]|nr:hypothetical protein [Planctomycetaceae bacterium]
RLPDRTADVANAMPNGIRAPRLSAVAVGGGNHWTLSVQRGFQSVGPPVLHTKCERHLVPEITGFLQIRVVVLALRQEMPVMA